MNTISNLMERENSYIIGVVLVVALVGIFVLFSQLSLGEQQDLSGQAVQKTVATSMKQETRQAPHPSTLNTKKQKAYAAASSLPNIPPPLSISTTYALPGEFQIDELTMDGALYPDVAASVDKFVVAWKHYPSPPGKEDVAAKVYNANMGAALTGVIPITDCPGPLTLTCVDEGPHVAFLTNGGFVVSWDVGTAQYGGPFTDDNNVFARVYDSLFNPVASEFMVHSSPVGIQRGSDVAALSNGNFVVVWVEAVSISDPATISGQLFDSSGNLIGSPFQINPSVQLINVLNGNPSVASKNGEFIVVWKGQDKSMHTLLWEQRFDNNANPVGAMLQVNTPGVTAPASSTSPSVGSFMGGEEKSAVSYLYDGSFVISWSFNIGPALTFDVYVKHYDSSGNALGPEFIVNPSSQTLVSGPAIVGKRFQNSYVPAWHYTSTGGDWDVYRKTYDLLDIPLGSEVLVNTATLNDQAFPAIASYRSGYVIVWAGFDSAGYTHVYGQRFDNADNPA